MEKISKYLRFFNQILLSFLLSYFVIMVIIFSYLAISDTMIYGLDERNVIQD